MKKIITILALIALLAGYESRATLGDFISDIAHVGADAVGTVADAGADVVDTVTGGPHYYRDGYYYRDNYPAAYYNDAEYNNYLNNKYQGEGYYYDVHPRRLQ